MMAAEAPGLLRTAHASGLNAVTRELTELHRAMLRAGGDSETAVRLSVLNLVVACTDDASAAMAREVVERIAAQAPARAIVVVADRTAASGIEADLSLQSSTSAGREQVCAELVLIHVGGESALHLGSVVTPLLLPDVPMYLWLAGAPPLEQALHSSTLDLCERLIVDSSAYADAAATLASLAEAVRGREHIVPIGDLAWLRTEQWREQIARSFDRLDIRPFINNVELVDIRSDSAPPPGASEGPLLAGWLRARLGTRLRGLTLSGGDGPLAALVMDCHHDGSHARVSKRRSGDILLTSVTIDGRDEVLRRSAPAEIPPLAALVGALIEQPTDPLYAQALRHAAQLAIR
jgi:glucose-6-phosphate dehydrogenase assembly protein OpcA